VKIADLGLARQLRHDGFADSMKGTPMLFAPEIIFKAFYNHKVDVWGIANIFYSCLTGKLLFTAAGGDYEDQLQKGTWQVPLEVKIS
jgi:serine/threonine protein kinase